MEEKSLNRLTAAILKVCRLKNIDCSNYQLMFMAAEEVLSKTSLSWVKKTASPSHSSALRVLSLSGDSASRF